MPVDTVLILMGAVILLGFTARLVFERTRIPDVLILMGFGVVLGRSISPETRLSIFVAAPYVGSLALIMILFEGGLRIDPGRALGQARPAAVLSLLTLGVTALLITNAAWLVGGLDLVPAALLGLVLGCTSSAIVMPVAQKISMPEETRTFLGLEAALSDTFAVVGLLTVLSLVETSSGWVQEGLGRLGRSLAIAAGASLLLSAAWLLVLEYTKRRPLSYLVTFAAMLLLYGQVERWHGSGPIAVLLFGILITESRRLPDWLFVFGRPAPGAGRQEAHEALQWFHEELTFLVRTFFFVYLGLLFESERLTPQVIAGSIALSGLIVLGRAASVYLFRRPLAEHPAWTIGVFLPRGLVSAVLATWPAHHGVLGTEQFMDYTIPVIIITNLVMAAGLLMRRSPPP